MTDTEDALKALDMAENHPARMSDGRGELNIPPYYEQWVGENLKPHLKTFRSALQSQGWPEISSAPRDGTPFIGWCGTYQVILWWDDEADGFTCGNRSRDYEELITHKPTHWQPLQPPPKVMK